MATQGADASIDLVSQKLDSFLCSQDAHESVPFFWGADAEDHLIVSDDIGIIKKGCGKSFAPFPKGTTFREF